MPVREWLCAAVGTGGDRPRRHLGLPDLGTAGDLQLLECPGRLLPYDRLLPGRGGYMVRLRNILRKLPRRLVPLGAVAGRHPVRHW